MESILLDIVQIDDGVDSFRIPVPFSELLF